LIKPTVRGRRRERLLAAARAGQDLSDIMRRCSTVPDAFDERGLPVIHLARIKSSSVSLDGNVVGPFGKPSIDEVRVRLMDRRPSARTFKDDSFLARDLDSPLLSLDDFDKVRDHEFQALINDRLRIELVYDSLYGGEGFKASWTGLKRSCV
jgi:hypothetical protein